MQPITAIAVLCCLSAAGCWASPSSTQPGPKPGPGAENVPQAKPGDEQELGVLTVADVFAALGMDGANLSYLDEPPGKLRELGATVVLRDTKAVVAVRIQLRYTPELMSATRKWDIGKVKAAKVLKVTLNGRD